MSRARVPRLRLVAALVAAAASLAVAALGAGPARSADISSRQLATLAARADGHPQALAQLQHVTAIDGRPTPLAALLRGSTPAQVNARLLALASATQAAALAGSPISAEAPRSAAASILSGARYGRATVTDPLISLLNDLSRLVNRLAVHAPGGPPAFWIAISVLVLLTAALATRRMLGRLARSGATGEVDQPSLALSPAALEREAETAETEGAFAEAVRLRFRAGLLSLAASSAIEYRPSVRTEEVAGQLRSPDFDRLREVFERITYGHRPAARADAEAARSGWRTLLARTAPG